MAIREKIENAISGLKEKLSPDSVGRKSGDYQVHLYNAVDRRVVVNAGLAGVGVGAGLLLLDALKPKKTEAGSGIREILKIEGLENPTQVVVEDGYNLPSFVQNERLFFGPEKQILASNINEADTKLGISGYSEAVVTTNTFNFANPELGPKELVLYLKMNVPPTPGDPNSGDTFYYDISHLSTGENVIAPKIVIEPNGQRGALYIANLADGRKRIYMAYENMAAKAMIAEFNTKVKPLLKLVTSSQSKSTINEQIRKINQTLYQELETAKVVYSYGENGEVAVSSPDLWSNFPINVQCNATGLQTAGAGFDVLASITDPSLAGALYFQTYFENNQMKVGQLAEISYVNGMAIDIGSGNKIYDAIIAVQENLSDQTVMRIAHVNNAPRKLPDLQISDKNEIAILTAVAVTGDDEVVVRLVVGEENQRKILKTIWGRDDNEPIEDDMTDALETLGLDLASITEIKLAKSFDRNQLDLAVVTDDSIRVFRFNTSYRNNIVTVSKNN